MLFGAGVSNPSAPTNTKGVTSLNLVAPFVMCRIVVEIGTLLGNHPEQIRLLHVRPFL